MAKRLALDWRHPDIDAEVARFPVAFCVQSVLYQTFSRTDVEMSRGDVSYDI